MKVKNHAADAVWFFAMGRSLDVKTGICLLCAGQRLFQSAFYLRQCVDEQVGQRQRCQYLKYFHFHHLRLPPHPEQLIGQCPHLPPQTGDLPFFLSFIIFLIISATITASTMQTVIVPMFAPIHDSIFITPYFVFTASFLFFTVSLVASLYGLTSI